MYIENWTTFYEQAQELFKADPLKTRYVMKYKHSEGKFVVKVTDDKTCLQYKTDQMSDLRKLEALNNFMFTVMSRGPEAADSVEDPAPVQQPAAPAPQSNSKNTNSSRRKRRG